MKNQIQKVSLLAIGIAAAGLSLATAQDKVDKSSWKDVGIKFPKPMFIGTPILTKSMNR